ncbi:MAG: alkaline phosphatase family protein [Actinomycetota bacterium]|nr:alkaline phosphatase family protein [Actinomycetota bacterium]
MPGCEFLRRTSRKGLILAIIDGLTPGLLERGIEGGSLPTLARLMEEGEYARATTTFPSLTPVCLASIATGAHPDVHHIPHLAWYHRGERRIVEYGSSFPAMRAVGARQAIRDTIFNLSHAHLNARATTLFEAVEDAGLTPAAINFTCYRGRTRHPTKLAALASRNGWYEALYGPRHFFFFNLCESDATGAPLAVRSRLAGSTDAYAGLVGRWLVTRDAFDLLVFYLPDLDYASHLDGPSFALAALERADASFAQLVEAAGGLDALLERYAVLISADHGQSDVAEVVSLQQSFADLAVFPGRRADPSDFDLVVTASNRAGQVYRLPSSPLDARELAERLDGVRGADVVLFRDEEGAVARRDGEELRFRPVHGSWRLAGEPAVLDSEAYPNGVERAWRALACPNAGDVLVSAREGFEFADLGGRHHAGGGSHGSLAARDSVVPVVAAGFDASPLPAAPATTDFAPLALTHLGVAPPASMLVASEAARG